MYFLHIGDSIATMGFSLSLVAVTPASVAAFPGRIALDTLPPLYRLFVKADTEGKLGEGDYRDWNAVSAWIAGMPIGFLPI